MIHSRWNTAFVCAIALTFCANEVAAIPRFAREYSVTCGTCHAFPARLNATGMEFVARRYRFSEQTLRTSTIPLSVWTSYLGQRQPQKEFWRGFPNRIELIAGDALSSRLSYFVEWRAVSLELRSDGTLRDRSGRFEDLFVVAEPVDDFTLTVGQFRQLSQVDVSQRVSISEPLAFSAGLRGERATRARLTGLRSFSPSGRSPAVRLQYHSAARPSSRGADGFFVIANVPMTGEFSIPLTKEARTEASLEFEAVPKGVFLETFLRSSYTSFGVHVFTGSNERFLTQLVATARLGSLFLTSAFGSGKDAAVKFTNLMLEAEYIPVAWGVMAIRFEDQFGLRREPSFIPYAAVQFPGTEYTVRIALEYRMQKGNNQGLIETSLIF